LLSRYLLSTPLRRRRLVLRGVLLCNNPIKGRCQSCISIDTREQVSRDSRSRCDDVDANRCNNHAGTRGAALRAADTVVPADRVFSAAEAKGGSAIDASKTALLLVEYQNEFTTEGGKLHDAVKESMAATGMLERSAKLADEARNKGVTIIHAPITFKEDASDNPNK